MDRESPAYPAIDPAQALQASFLVAAATILFINSIPSLASRFVSYGSRTTTQDPQQKKEANTASARNNVLTSLLDYLANFQVPHSWFKHFYLASVASSVFWAYQLLTHGSLFQIISTPVAAHSGPSRPSMSLRQVSLTWLLLLMQGTRRLYESLSMSKPSKSTMWVGHWVLGLLFYLSMGIAIWIEGLLLSLSLIPPVPSARTFLILPSFILASGLQHDIHAYLSSLPKNPYTFPTHPNFAYTLTPHYTCECIIYLSLALLAAPAGMWVNRTVLFGLVFVIVNLGITAKGTREWYAREFGEEKVKGRATMLPGIW
ncbi:hypothetical protein M501DRAFT_590721 [Patellaria atrata CBS 101060]|uniref:Polyprenal reductase n=1 Tax=Patellaria atrata CBS 101060 TaxID=1346257 RepID=A0A9P4VIW3_9PEZI|nr:hypothetical protein M501DRAFT_590721 [Patellaria atrata CBS 101060]